MLIEALCLDVEDVRLSLARGLSQPAEHSGVPCLDIILDFIAKGNYHPLWYHDSDADQAELTRRERSFDICKAATIKAVVEVAAEEKNLDVLWDDTQTQTPGGSFVGKMVGWIKAYNSESEKAGVKENNKTDSREDLVICASLSLGNMCRRGQCAV